MTFTEFLQIIAGGIGSLGFACLFNIRGKRLIMATVGGVLSWFLFIILHPAAVRCVPAIYIP